MISTGDVRSKLSARTNWLLVLVLLASVLVRIAAALYLGDRVVSLPGTADQVSYHSLALRVLEGHGFSFGKPWWPATAADAPTAHWSYLYTLYLVVVYAVFGPHPLVARIIQAVVVGILQPYLAYRLAEQVLSARSSDAASESRSSRFSDTFWQYTPLLAAAITSAYLYFIYYAAALMTEAFYFVAIMASLSLTIDLTRQKETAGTVGWSAALGVTIGIAVLLRQLFLLLVPFIYLWLVFAARRRGAEFRVLGSILLGVFVIGLLILPFTLFNYARFDRFVLLNTNSGYAFFLANHPVYGTTFLEAAEMSGSYQDLIPANLRELDEAALDQALLKRGLQFVWDDPGRYLALSLSRIPIYFKFWPDPDSGLLSNLSRVGSFGITIPFMFAGLIYVPRHLWRKVQGNLLDLLSAPMTLLYLFMILYAAIHILSWSQVRYRLPIDTVLVIFAAVALVAITELSARKIRQRAQRSNKERATSI